LDLGSINSELMQIQHSVFSANLNRDEKKEELKRLQEALKELEGCDTDYSESKDLCLKPEFTTKTFHGEVATDVEGFKEDELQVSYTGISDEQLSKAKTEISDQMEVIEEEISSMGENITTMESRHTSLMEKKEQVKDKQ